MEYRPILCHRIISKRNKLATAIPSPSTLRGALHQEERKKKKFKFDEDEIRIIFLALNELKNQLIQEGRYTDAVDELLLRLV